MTINRNNFEAYLLDYLEGNLDPLLTADLMAFLAENPEFEKYVPDFEIQPLIAQSGDFQNKQLLKKDIADIPAITPENFDEFCIASCEGLLCDNDAKRLEAYVAQHAEKQKDLELFRALKLQPDHSIRFHDKLLLKKPAGRSLKLRILYYGLSLAASFALILLLTVNRESTEINDGVTWSHPVIIPYGNSGSSIPESIPPRIEVVPFIKKKNINAVDTIEPSIVPLIPRREIIRLAALEPIAAELPPAHPDPELVLPEREGIVPANNLKKTKPGWLDSEGLLGTLVSKVDFWKTAETAIEGFNYLTEAQLSVTRRMDENGNTSGVVVNTERYSIATK